VVVAVALVDAVQVPLHQIVDVVAVRYRRMTAARTMNVRGIVGGTSMPRRTRPRVLGIHRDHALVDMTGVVMMEVPVMKVIRVITVSNGSVAAALTMNVIVAVVRRMIFHPQRMVGVRSAAQGREVRGSTA
jgi:hypothetical protein